MIRIHHFIILIATLIVWLPLTFAQTKGRRVGKFLQEVRKFYNRQNGLPSDTVLSIASTPNDRIYAGTENGMARFAQGRWEPVNSVGKYPVVRLSTSGDTVAAYAERKTGSRGMEGIVYLIRGRDILKEVHLTESFARAHRCQDLVLGRILYLGTRSGLFGIDYHFPGRSRTMVPEPLGLSEASVRQIALSSGGALMVAADRGLFRRESSGKSWHRLLPRSGVRSWALVDVRGAIFDRRGRGWFASPQGTGCLTNTWQLFTGREGLPYNDFTRLAAGEDGVVWFGTHKGAIRFDGRSWEYRQGLRWLPDDDVRDVAVSFRGDAWFATSRGVGCIARKPMTLAEKAAFYEAEIDRCHRRTPYEFVLEVALQAPGDKNHWRQMDSDNDGLWTSMYGAGECFAYAATRDPRAKSRAKKAFEALRFLGQVTRGTQHSPPPGFVARTVLPTSGPDPNDGQPKRDWHHKQTVDRLWKILHPRWPKSADGKWYWKSDTSSDELDGHYFFYAQYYDLVAETEAEKTRVREHVRALTDHLIEHDFMLIDHDGTPTRWAHFNPYELNHDKNWFVERGLNSLSMLSYLAVAAHITGDKKYRKIADTLIEKHSYLQNVMNQKFHHGTGTGNQSDDEMAFMCYYNLLKYETDPERRSRYAISFWNSWRMEEPEMNPFFNFAFAASCAGLVFTDAWGEHPTDPVGNWLGDAIETLKRFPLDRCNWRHQNSHRLDILFLHEANQGFDEKSFVGRGYRVNGKVIPVDECYFSHWNYDPWRLDSGGDGRILGDGTVFLLPYYMGLYHGFIVE